MSIGENIRKIRKQKGLTQKKLAELSGLNEVTIRSYELGKFKPKIETIQRIANALDVTIGDLDNGYMEMKAQNEKAHNLLYQLQYLLKDIQTSDKTDNEKLIETEKIESLIHDTQNLIRIINYVMKADKEVKSIKEEIYQSKLEIDDMFLSILHCLNLKGQKKVMDYVFDITRIEEYLEKKDKVLDYTADLAKIKEYLEKEYLEKKEE